MTSAAEYLPRSDGDRIAYNRLGGARPGVVFLHGLMSDRGGTKALALAAHCARKGYAYVRFDMYGHGASSGRFEDGGISRWTDDAVAVLEQLTEGPQVLVGSSMGGWVMVRAALRCPARVAALVGIAVGPDFTEELMWERFSEMQREQLMTAGSVEIPSSYNSEPYRISRHLIEDGRQNLVLGGDIPIMCPVVLIHGQQDADVPWQTSLRLADKIAGGDVEICLVKDGDHRLSQPRNLQQLCLAVDDVIGRIAT